MRLEITKAEAAKTIMAAYQARTLAGQHPNAVAVYFETLSDGTVVRCAIGCLFTEAEARELQDGENYRLVPNLIHDDILVVDDPEWFNRVQRLHDTMYRGPAARAAFLEHLDAAA